jgi:hypothetical protein
MQLSGNYGRLRPLTLASLGYLKPWSPNGRDGVKPTNSIVLMILWSLKAESLEVRPQRRGSGKWDNGKLIAKESCAGYLWRKLLEPHL